MLTIEDTNVEQVIKLAETYFERFDPTLFLQLLPPSTSVSLLSRYFKMVLEAQTSQKRSLQVGKSPPPLTRRITYLNFFFFFE